MGYGVFLKCIAFYYSSHYTNTVCFFFWSPSILTGIPFAVFKDPQPYTVQGSENNQGHVGLHLNSLVVAFLHGWQQNNEWPSKKKKKRLDLMHARLKSIKLIKPFWNFQRFRILSKHFYYYHSFFCNRYAHLSISNTARTFWQHLLYANDFFVFDSISWTRSNGWASLMTCVP